MLNTAADANSQNAVTAYFTNKQLLPLGFAKKYLAKRGIDTMLF